MTLKEVQRAKLKNEKLRNSKSISIQEYIKKQIKLLEEIDILLYKLEHFNFRIFKNINARLGKIGKMYEYQVMI